MDYFILLFQNRIKIILNKFLYFQKESKKDKSGFIALIIGMFILSLVIMVLSLGVSTVVIELMQSFFENSSISLQLNWYSIWLLIFFLLIASDNLLNQYYEFSQMNEYKLVLSSPIDIKQFLLVKLVEPYLTKVIIGLLVVVPIMCNIRLKFQLSLINTGLFALTLGVFLLLSMLTRSLLLIFMIKRKAKNKSLVSFTIFNITVYYIIISLFLTSLKPFTSWLPSFINEFIEKIIYLFPLYLIDELNIGSLSPFTLMVEVLNDILTMNVNSETIMTALLMAAIVGIIVFAFFYQTKRLERQKTLEMFFENIQIKKVKVKNSREQKGSFLNYSNLRRLVLVKDIKLLSRENKIYWFASIFTIMFAYGTLLAGYYIANSQLDLPNIENYIGIILCVFGNSLIANSMLDKYGFDAEGNNFHLLKLAPIDSRDIVLSKFSYIFVMSIPFWILFAIITTVFFNVNIIFVLLLLISSTFAFGMMCLFSSIVYPDFNPEDITQIPTMKSKLLSNGISCFYLSVIGIILYYVPNFVFGVMISFLASILIGFVMLYLTVYKVEEYTAY